MVYTAWEQSRIDYYPPVRIHDSQVIATRLQAPTPIMLADLTAPDPLAAYRSTFYQLDGGCSSNGAVFCTCTWTWRFVRSDFQSKPMQATWGAPASRTQPVAS